MKKIAIGIVLLIALTILAVWATKKDTTSTIGGELSNFAVEDTAAINHIVLKDETGQVIDLMRGDDGWILDEEFVARPDAVKILLTTINRVSVKAPVSQVQMNTVLKTIISKHCLVELYDKNGMIKSFYVGGADKDHSGTYMLMKGSQRPFLMHIEGFHGFLTPRFFTNQLEWRHRGIFELSASQIESIAVEYYGEEEKNFTVNANGNQSFSVLAGKDLQPAQAIDSFMLSAYLSNYKQVHYESFEETKSDAFIDSVKQSTPIFSITVVNNQGDSKKVIAFKKPLKDGYDPNGNEIEYDLDRLYLWIDSGEVVVGQYAIFDKLTKGIAFFKKR
jgi:hypothetical protein